MMTVAREALDEVLQSYILVAAIALAVAHALLAPAVGSAALGDGARGIAAVGLWMSSLAGLVGAVSIGIRAVGGALADGSAQLTLVRPISRTTWVTGRALGAGAGVMLWSAAVLASWAPVALWWGLLDARVIVVYAALTLELWLICAWALLLSTLARPAIAATATGSLVFAGLFADEVLLYASEGGPLSTMTATVLYAILPDLDLFDLHRIIVYDLPVDWATFAWAALYALATADVLIWLAIRAIAHRDLA